MHSDFACNDLSSQPMEALVNDLGEGNKVDLMTPEQERAFWASFTADLSQDDGAAARAISTQAIPHIAAPPPRRQT